MDGMVWHIGDVIRKKREAARLSLKELANKAGVRPNTMGELERYGDRYEPETLRKVVKALKTTEAEVFALVPSVTPSVTPPIETEDPVDARAWAKYRALPESLKHSARTVIDSLTAAVPLGGFPTGNETLHAGASSTDVKRAK